MENVEVDPPRLVRLQGAHNFRDLGGYASADGRRVRYGQLFRSDSLSELTDEDATVLIDLGVRTVVDLRTATEVTREGRARVHADVRYEHRSVLREEGTESQAAPADDDQAARYLWYLTESPAVIGSVLELAATRTCRPLVFHCAAGKDRTGVVAAILLECLGVARPVIVADYVATDAAMPAILRKLRSRLGDERMAQVPASRVAVRSATMERLLGAVDEHFGGAVAFARSVGLGDDWLADLRDGLLTDVSAAATGADDSL